MINNYRARYDLKSEENFEKIEKVIENKEYYVYKEILKLVDSCRIVTTGPKGVIIETDAKENHHLLEDITHKFFTTRLGQRRAEKKVGHGYITGNLFVLLKIHYF